MCLICDEIGRGIDESVVVPTLKWLNLKCRECSHRGMRACVDVCHEGKVSDLLAWLNCGLACKEHSRPVCMSTLHGTCMLQKPSQEHFEQPVSVGRGLQALSLACDCEVRPNDAVHIFAELVCSISQVYRSYTSQ